MKIQAEVILYKLLGHQESVDLLRIRPDGMWVVSERSPRVRYIARSNRFCSGDSCTENPCLKKPNNVEDAWTIISFDFFSWVLPDCIIIISFYQFFSQVSCLIHQVVWNPFPNSAFIGCSSQLCLFIWVKLQQLTAPAPRYYHRVLEPILAMSHRCTPAPPKHGQGAAIVRCEKGCNIVVLV